jgi:hypothetical protein
MFGRLLMLSGSEATSHQNSVVRVSHGDKPLQGVSVWVSQATEGNANEWGHSRSRLELF